MQRPCLLAATSEGWTSAFDLWPQYSALKPFQKVPKTPSVGAKHSQYTRVYTAQPTLTPHRSSNSNTVETSNQKEPNQCDAEDRR